MNGSWKFTFFIARELQKQSADSSHSSGKGSKVARPIARIATVSIALAMIVNIITIAVVDGFQQEVRSKVIGFNSHISIQTQGEGSLFESAPLTIDPHFESMLQKTIGVKALQRVAYKPGLLQSVSDTEQREILGVIFKGVDRSYNWNFLKAHLLEGRLPKFDGNSFSEILISRRIANDLHYRLGDTAKSYFVKQQPLLRRFKIVGIYETGLEDFDKEMVFCDLAQVQALNDWGIQASIVIDDTLSNGKLIIRADILGKSGKQLLYDWGSGFESYGGFYLCPKKDTLIRLIVKQEESSLPEVASSVESKKPDSDTAFLKITVSGDVAAPCVFDLNEDGTLKRTYLDAEGFHYSAGNSKKKVSFEIRSGKGTQRNFIGSYELSVNDWDNLDHMKHLLQKKILFQDRFDNQMQVKSVRDYQGELFVWLGFLDINMAIILLLMLIIRIINMGSALLVIILVKTNFIGIMKAMGTTNGFIRKLFVVLGGSLIIKGMIWGNVIGIGFCLLQHYFGILPLDPKIYYLNKVPVLLDFFKVIGLNLLTLVICVLALIVPSVVITRISPAKSIRFR